MLAQLKAQVRKVERAGPAGRRFQNRYRTEHHAGKKRDTRWRVVSVLAAIVAAAIGVVLTIMPGPAIPFYLIAGALLATESIVIAKGLDYLEVRGRKVYKLGHARWRKFSPGLKRAIVCLGALCSLTATYISFQIMR